MKIYVIKRNNETYFEKWFDHFVRFVDNVRYSEMFHNKVSAEEMMDFITRNRYKFNISKEELSIVEYSLMSETELAEHDKQVRKEVLGQVRDIARKIARPTTEYDGGEFDYDIDGITLDHLLMWLEDEELDLLKNYLDQIQGEQNENKRSN